MYLSHSARQIQNLTAETLKLLIGGFLRRVAGDGGMAVAPRVFVDIPRGPTRGDQPGDHRGVVGGGASEASKRNAVREVQTLRSCSASTPE
jgi:hypothetical protein